MNFNSLTEAAGKRKETSYYKASLRAPTVVWGARRYQPLKRVGEGVVDRNLRALAYVNPQKMAFFFQTSP